jgi:hypothetical protein
MADVTVLADNERGRITVEGNEVLATSKIPDAAKFRVRAPRVPGESGGGGAISFDAQDDQDGRWKEVQLITGAMNGARGGEGKLIVLAEGGIIDDAHQRTIIEWDSNKVEFKVPISAPNLNGGGTSAPATDMLKSADGRMVLALQMDGNMVLYLDGQPVKALFGLSTDKLW